MAGKPVISLDEYLALTHIHISTRRNGLGEVDLALGKMGLQRKITLRSQHYLMASNVLQQTDMVMTVPERFARRHALHLVQLAGQRTCPTWKPICTGMKAPSKTRPTAGCASN